MNHFESRFRNPEQVMALLDLEKADAMTADTTASAPSITNNKLSFKNKVRTANLFMAVPLFIAYAGLYTTYRYLGPSGPGSAHRENDKVRITPLVIILTLLGPELIQKAFAVTTSSASQNESPCFSFGWLAYGASLLLSVVCGGSNILPKPECEAKTMNMKTGKTSSNNSFSTARLLRDLESRYFPTSSAESPVHQDNDNDIIIEILQPTGPAPSPLSLKTILQNRSSFTAILQMSVSGLFWYHYNDLSALLLLSTSILLVEATVNLPAWTRTSQKTSPETHGAYALMRDTGCSPTHIFIIQSPFQITSTRSAPHATRTSLPWLPTAILVCGGFFSQAMLYTQISDAAAAVMLLIMFTGTISNVAIVSMPSVPHVGGVELRSVGVVLGDGSVIGALREVERRWKGYGEVLGRTCLAEVVGEWTADKGEVGEMD